LTFAVRASALIVWTVAAVVGVAVVWVTLGHVL
jgi:hypothetical protein